MCSTCLYTLADERNNQIRLLLPVRRPCPACDLGEAGSSAQVHVKSFIWEATPVEVSLLSANFRPFAVILTRCS